MSGGADLQRRRRRFHGDLLRHRRAMAGDPDPLAPLRATAAFGEGRVPLLDRHRIADPPPPPEDGVPVVQSVRATCSIS